MCARITSSGEAMRLQESSTNLYSMFWMKSSRARPSLSITNTARWLWGSLMPLLSTVRVSIRVRARVSERASRSRIKSALCARASLQARGAAGGLR